MELIGENRAFGGRHLRYTHKAETTQCDMTFAIFLPPFASKEKPVPVLYWLSGLTCTDQNFMQKAGAMKLAAELGMAIVAPDTSPRGENVPDDEEGSYDFGLGAGVITSDLTRAHRVADALEAVNVWVNTYNLIPADWPFGGAKQSGFGRESSQFAIEAYTEVKATYIQL